MNYDPTRQHVIMLSIPRAFIREALKDIQRGWETGRAYVRSCDYIRHRDQFVVQVVMTDSYPFLENEWERKWNRP